MSELSQREIARAVTNNPALSDAEFKLGDRVFKIVDLAYDDYVLFLSYLQPMLEAVAGKVASAAGLDSSAAGLDENMSIATIIKYCSHSVPEMALLVCRQSDPDISLDEVKLLGKTPFKMAGIVFKQIEQNRIVQDIGDFFVQILPLLRVKAR